MADQKNGIPAVVLAGAPAEPEIKAKYGIDNRAELPIGGKAMIQHVLDALRGSPSVGGITVVGEVACEGAERIIPSAGSLVDNLIAGVQACGKDGGKVLMVTSDIPMLSSEALEDFIGKCGETEADFHYAIISKATNDARFPGMERTYVKLAEGTYTGGNVMMMNSRVILENAGLITDLMAARKKPLKLAGIIGMRFLVRAVLAQIVWPGALKVSFAEQTVGRIVHARLKAVPTSYAEIGADVDKLEHVEFAEAAMGSDPK